KKRPTRLRGITEAIETPMGRAYVTLNFNGEDGNRPFEFFATIGKAGSDVTAFTEAIARLISLALRSRVPLKEIVTPLEALGGATTIGFGESRVSSVPDAFGKCLRRVMQEQGEPLESVGAGRYGFCPSCLQYSLENTEGCQTCR